MSFIRPMYFVYIETYCKVKKAGAFATSGNDANWHRAVSVLLIGSLQAFKSLRMTMLGGPAAD
ncbi:uncharacterized protein FIBRA_07324 [Fibroporia radiculosa]|uniref:Uncharacterized protein n=1 Tax=Fibroporia radiculosa TaxID=599839 RepID=J4IBR4_9APHY|nr:uncharacterized protein FIBRA_07324 [Fibroporia radiculosa]CCM05116.1 predicted protein [Fibroporia radiculosa]